jgi:maleylacetate reductase
MTRIRGVTEGGLKKTGRDARVLPKTVIHDPTHTRGLPKGMSAVSGINAIAHAVEGLYAHDGNPVTARMAEEGMRARAAGSPRVTAQPDDIDARSDCLYGAWLCGAVLGHLGMGLHHKPCRTLGGTCNLPHATAYNAAAARDGRSGARVERVVSRARATRPRGETQNAACAERHRHAAERTRLRGRSRGPEPVSEPAPAGTHGLRQLLDDAWHGRAPA